MRKLFRNEVIQEHVIPTLIVLSWFGVLLVLAIMMTSCEKQDDCKTYRCGDKEVNVINHAAYYKYDECECIEKFK